MPRRRSPKPSAFTNRAEGDRNESGGSDLRGHGYRDLNGYVDCRRRSWTCQCARRTDPVLPPITRPRHLPFQTARLARGGSRRSSVRQGVSWSIRRCLRLEDARRLRIALDMRLGDAVEAEPFGSRSSPTIFRRIAARLARADIADVDPGPSDPSGRPTTCRGRRAPRPTCGSDPTADRTPSSPNRTGHPARRLRRSRPSRASRPPPGSPAP